MHIKEAAGNEWGTGGGIQYQIDNWKSLEIDAIEWFKFLKDL
ncbi:hypothetical protein [Dysgonomonas sp. 520]|nr:hypothetical protein [Dysgonomonas sp. 520]